MGRRTGLGSPTSTGAKTSTRKQVPCAQVGTLNYMSPEAILGGATNIRGGPPMKVPPRQCHPPFSAPPVNDCLQVKDEVYDHPTCIRAAGQSCMHHMHDMRAVLEVDP